MKILNSIFLTLLIVGGLNWGIIGLFNVDIVAMLFGGMGSIISRTIYTLVGVSALWAFGFYMKLTREDNEVR